jgi:hypothetical protein
MQINCSECPKDHQYAQSVVELFVGMAIQPSAKVKAVKKAIKKIAFARKSRRR